MVGSSWGGAVDLSAGPPSVLTAKAMLKRTSPQPEQSQNSPPADALLQRLAALFADDFPPLRHSIPCAAAATAPAATTGPRLVPVSVAAAFAAVVAAAAAAARAGPRPRPRRLGRRHHPVPVAAVAPPLGPLPGHPLRRALPRAAAAAAAGLFGCERGAHAREGLLASPLELLHLRSVLRGQQAALAGEHLMRALDLDPGAQGGRGREGRRSCDVPRATRGAARPQCCAARKGTAQQAP